MTNFSANSTSQDPLSSESTPTNDSLPDFKTDPFFNLKDKWITTGEDELTHYFEQGDGVPVLLLHGSGIGTSAALTWWLNLPQLSQNARTVAFDFIGYGQTVCAPDTCFGIKEWGAHTLRLMDALGIEKTWLVGSSLGGWVALQMAIDYPERIYGVVSIGTGGAKRFGASAKHAHHSKKSKPPLTKELIHQDLLKNIGHDALICDTLVDIRYESALKEQANGIRPALVAARDYDREGLPLESEVLGRLSHPVLLVHGINDKVVPLSRSMELLSAIPLADAHIYSVCGHWPHIGKAEAFNMLVTNFIADANVEIA